MSAGFRQKSDIFSRKISLNLVAIERKANEDKNIIPFVHVETKCFVTLKVICPFTQPRSKGSSIRLVLEQMQNSGGNLGELIFG